MADILISVILLHWIHPVTQRQCVWQVHCFHCSKAQILFPAKMSLLMVGSPATELLMGIYRVIIFLPSEFFCVRRCHSDFSLVSKRIVFLPHGSLRPVVYQMVKSHFVTGYQLENRVLFKRNVEHNWTIALYLRSSLFNLHFSAFSRLLYPKRLTFTTQHLAEQ